MNAEEAVARLDALTGVGGVEVAHSMADDILLAVVPVDVEKAYERLQARCSWWATA